MMEPTSQPFDIRELFWRLHRYSWLLVLPPVAVLCIASVYYKLSPVTFESHVSVSLDSQANVGPAIQGMVNADRERGTSREKINLVNTRVQSREFLAAAVERLGMLNSPGVQAAADAAARQNPGAQASELAIRIAGSSLARKIQVVPMEGSLVRVTAVSGTAEGAQRLATTISDLLVEGSRRSNLERVQARGEFSQDQIIVYRERLRDSENAYQTYQEEVLRRANVNTPITAANVNEARGQVRATDLEIEQIRDRIDAARSQWDQYVPHSSPPVLESRESSAMERRLLNLERTFTAAPSAEAQTDGARQGQQAGVASARLALLGEYEALAAAVPGDYPGAARAAAAGLATDRAILRTLRGKRDWLVVFISQVERGLENSPREQMELARLRAAVESNRELVNALQREAQSSRISEALASSALGPRITVVDPPLLPLGPSTPDPLRIFGAALLLGPLLSVGMVVAAEKFSIVIRTVEQVEAELGARVLGTVPRIEGWDSGKGYLARHWAVLSIVLVVVLTGLFHSLNATTHSDRRSRTEASPTAP